VLDEEIIEQLRQAAEAEGESMSVVARRIFRKHFGIVNMTPLPSRPPATIEAPAEIAA